MITIYLHNNNINGKCYVGQTCNLKTRWSGEGTQYRKSKKFSNAIKKYGWQNFSHFILCVCKDEESDYWERKFIKDFDCIKNGYNLNTGGNKNKHLSEETKHKLSLKRKGVPISEEHRQHILNSCKPGYFKHTEETKRRISMSKIGHKGYYLGKHLSKEHKLHISQGNKGKPKSKETCLKISLKALERYKDKENIKKLKESLLKYTTTIDQYSLDGKFIKRYIGLREAERQTGIDRCSISRVIKGKQKSAGCFLWKKVLQ